MAHTKGPWCGGDKISGLPTYVYCDDATGSAVALTSFEFVRRTSEEMEANARLIAAAPDLLEFVQQIFNGIDTGMITIDTPADETLANILLRGRKALSKATGAI